MNSASVSEEISNDIVKINTSANHMSANSEEVFRNARELSALAEPMKEIVDRFDV